MGFYISHGESGCFFVGNDEQKNLLIEIPAEKQRPARKYVLRLMKKFRSEHVFPGK